MKDGESMRNEVQMILEKITKLPVMLACKRSIVLLTNSSVDMSAHDFDKAVKYIWENELIKILKVGRIGVYIAQVYVDVTT